MSSNSPSLLLRMCRFAGTRFRGLKGLDRLLRVIHHPDRRQVTWARSVEAAYPEGPRYLLETRWFTEWTTYFYGTQDEKIHDWIVRRAKPEWNAFDIGANFGYFTCLLASRGASVHAFEPIPWLAERIEANLALNGLKNAAVNRLALSDHAGTAKINLPARTAANWGTSSLVHKPVNHGGDQLEVTLNTLDEYCRTRVVGIDFIKLDVEGAEDLVLRGGEEVLARHRPAIIVECNRESFDFVTTLLARLSYERVDGRPMTAAAHDIIAVPRQ